MQSLGIEVESLSTDILHHSQQDPKNRIYQRALKGFRVTHLQETRFLMSVQDVSQQSITHDQHLHSSQKGLLNLKPRSIIVNRSK